MAQKATLPTFKLPKVDLEAVFALQKANLATVHEAQTVLVDAAQAMFKAQYGLAEETLKTAEDTAGNKDAQKPEQIFNGARVNADKALAVAKENLDRGVAAQSKVADLIAKRVAANFDELKALAA